MLQVKLVSSPLSYNCIINLKDITNCIKINEILLSWLFILILFYHINVYVYTKVMLVNILDLMKCRGGSQVLEWCPQRPGVWHWWHSYSEWGQRSRFGGTKWRRPERSLKVGRSWLMCQFVVFLILAFWNYNYM